MSIGDIFPESRGESKNQWEYDGDGLPTVREEKLSSIVKMFIPCAIDATVVVVPCHPSHHGNLVDTRP